jgi:nucleotide-binding universal stress UspA family protein
MRARLTLLHAVPPLPSFAYRAGIDVQLLQDEALAEGDGILRAAIDRVPDDVPVTHLLPQGDAGVELVRQVERGHHDLVILGTRGRGRLASNVFGSVAAHVHFNAQVALLIIH